MVRTMIARPVSRYFNFGVTFRWVKGQSEIAVKRGYVWEGRPVVVMRPPRQKVTDRPYETPYDDRNTWIAAIPVNAAHWEDNAYFIHTAHTWARNNPKLIGIKKHPGT